MYPMRTFLFIFGFVFLSSNFFGQKKEKMIPKDRFKFDSLAKIILKELNNFRLSRGLDTLELSEMLQMAGNLSAEKMASRNNDKVVRKTTVRHLGESGATKKGVELTMKAAIVKGKEYISSHDVAKTIYERWESNPKNVSVLLNPKFTFVGISCALNPTGKKVFVSAFFGGYDITNGGVIYKKQLAVPFNSRSKKFKDPEPKTCKNCEKWHNYDVLQKGISVVDDKILLRYKNARDLRRILKKPKDGIAIDLVQRSQFISADYNIVDNNLANKGIMSKVIYRDKFFKKNLLLTKNKKANRKQKEIQVQVGTFDKRISGPYEINLIIVQDGKICKSVSRGYTETAIVESNTPIGLMPWPNSRGLKPAFEPRSESSLLNMMIPFEKNKFEFKQEDIQPFIKALNEPDFIIDGLYVYAYSSIEGDSAENSKLQQKRAESVVKVLQSFQKNKILPSIQTKDSWNLFVIENEEGKYADLVNLGKQKAIKKINNDKNLEKELEPILVRERFAEIIMDITYDVSGEKEKKFSTIQFNKAIQYKNQNQAYKIIEFIGKRMAEGRYSQELLDSLRIEENTENIGILNNLVYTKYQISNSVEEEDAATFDRLIKLEPSNPMLKYNRLFCQLKLDSNAGNAEHQAQVQADIDALYGKLDSNYVNGLNIEWQFKIMETFDTLKNAETLIDACITRIKSFYKIKDASWQNGLKLAYVFSRAKDYNYAASILEPYLKMKDVSENLIFTYISYASRIPEKYYSRTFARALVLAQEKNPSRYCKLFGEPFMTFQVLENRDVKRVYYLNCGDKN